MTQNNNIDQMIKEALTEDEQVLFSSFEEQNMLQKFGGLFQGKMKWLNAMGMLVQFIMFGLAVYLGYCFFNTTVITEMIQYGFGAFLLMMAVTGIKFFHFMEINKNEVIREMKRLELQVSLLAGKVKEK